MKNRKGVYFNSKQLEFIRAQQPIKVWIGGRGSGKSSGIGGNQYNKATNLPRAKNFFASTTYNQILNSTLPAIEGKFQDMGLIRDIHYVVGKKPPRNWPRPYSAPTLFKNVLTMFNGYSVQFLSMDRPDLARGGSYDGGEIDEVALLKQDTFTKILVPMVRGNKHKFSHWLHGSVSAYTSIPWKSSGYWVLEYEEKAKADPKNYFYMESTAYDNVHVLGIEYIERMKREMHHLEFMIEVMNMRVRKVLDGFYPKFSEDKHCYTPAYLYTDTENGITTAGRTDYNPDEMLDATFDFSGWFNCVIILQSTHENYRYKEKGIDQAWVKGDDKVDQLVDKVCEQYRQHRFKRVRVWGEPRGHDKNPYGETLYEKIARRFKAYGWEVEIAVQPIRTNLHEERMEFMDEILDEKTPELPILRLNEETCKDVIIAIQTTEVDHNGKKVKTQEKDRNFPQEHAPHFTDALDYYFVQKHSWRLQSHSGGFEYGLIG
jgi:hypothetical protein